MRCRARAGSYRSHLANSKHDTSHNMCARAVPYRSHPADMIQTVQIASNRDLSAPKDLDNQMIEGGI